MFKIIPDVISGSILADRERGELEHGYAEDRFQGYRSSPITCICENIFRNWSIVQTACKPNFKSNGYAKVARKTKD